MLRQPFLPRTNSPSDPRYEDQSGTDCASEVPKFVNQCCAWLAVLPFWHRGVMSYIISTLRLAGIETVWSLLRQTVSLGPASIEGDCGRSGPANRLAWLSCARRNCPHQALRPELLDHEATSENFTACLPERSLWSFFRKFRARGSRKKWTFS